MNAAIGPASADRQVLVAIMQDQSGAGTLSGTIGGNAGTIDVAEANGTIALMRYNLTTGTTANITVTVTGVNLGWCGFVVWSITGVTATPSATQSVAYGFNASPHVITATVPASGVGAAACWFLTDTTGTWSNATQDSSDTSGGSNRLISGSHTTGTGSQSPTYTGANFNGGAMVMGTWGP